MNSSLNQLDSFSPFMPQQPGESDGVNSEKNRNAHPMVGKGLKDLGALFLALIMLLDNTKKRPSRQEVEKIIFERGRDLADILREIHRPFWGDAMDSLALIYDMAPHLLSPEQRSEFDGMKLDFKTLDKNRKWLKEHLKPPPEPERSAPPGPSSQNLVKAGQKSDDYYVFMFPNDKVPQKPAETETSQCDKEQDTRKLEQLRAEEAVEEAIRKKFRREKPMKDLERRVVRSTVPVKESIVSSKPLSKPQRSSFASTNSASTSTAKNHAAAKISAPLVGASGSSQQEQNTRKVSPQPRSTTPEEAHACERQDEWLELYPPRPEASVPGPVVELEAEPRHSNRPRGQNGAMIESSASRSSNMPKHAAASSSSESGSNPEEPEVSPELGSNSKESDSPEAQASSRDPGGPEEQATPRDPGVSEVQDGSDKSDGSSGSESESDESDNTSETRRSCEGPSRSQAPSQHVERRQLGVASASAPERTSGARRPTLSQQKDSSVPGKTNTKLSKPPPLPPLRVVSRSRKPSQPQPGLDSPCDLPSWEGPDELPEPGARLFTTPRPMLSSSYSTLSPIDVAPSAPPSSFMSPHTRDQPPVYSRALGNEAPTRLSALRITPASSTSMPPPPRPPVRTLAARKKTIAHKAKTDFSRIAHRRRISQSSDILDSEDEEMPDSHDRRASYTFQPEHTVSPGRWFPTRSFQEPFRCESLDPNHTDGGEYVMSSVESATPARARNRPLNPPRSTRNVPKTQLPRRGMDGEKNARRRAAKDARRGNAKRSDAERRDADVVMNDSPPASPEQQPPAPFVSARYSPTSASLARRHSPASQPQQQPQPQPSPARQSPDIKSEDDTSDDSDYDLKILCGPSSWVAATTRPPTAEDQLRMQRRQEKAKHRAARKAERRRKKMMEQEQEQEQQKKTRLETKARLPKDKSSNFVVEIPARPWDNVAPDPYESSGGDE
ncbi:hypothetical protein MKZ38_002208 [Zalerion maritima]|uniref:Uncharacterized protein n=1 Tax=Zalerion maritima TaxID=339359 RepID=A0AAD5RPC6_9PEZI|nr:hypothetical protein MKZ38_002208 [Zalerion maritima]